MKNNSNDIQYICDSFSDSEGYSSSDDITPGDKSEKITPKQKEKNDKKLASLIKRLSKKHQKENLTEDQITKLAQDELDKRSERKSKNKEKSKQKHLDNLKELKSRKSYYNEQDDLLNIQKYYKEFFPNNSNKFDKSDYIKEKINYESLNKLTFSNFKKAKRREFSFSINSLV